MTREISIKVREWADLAVVLEKISKISGFYHIEIMFPRALIPRVKTLYIAKFNSESIDNALAALQTDPDIEYAMICGTL